MSRLERLVSLLDTGSSAFVRNAAGDQLADVQKSHPEELFSLLGRILPFLSSPKWDTRIAAARALGLIADNAPWSPKTGGGRAGVEHVKEIVEEVKQEGDAICDVKIEEDEDIKVPIPRNYSAQAPAAASEDRLSFETLDVRSLIEKGVPLLASAGKEYDLAFQNMDPIERLKTQQQALKRNLGIAAQFSDDLADDMLLDDDLALAPPKPKARPRHRPKSVKEEQKEESASGRAAPTNARMRALAKRKAKLGVTPAAKVQIIDSANKSPTPTGASSPAKVIVEHKPKTAIELTSLVAVKDGNTWPLTSICNVLMTDMFNPSWEVRHGALLGLRALVKAHGTTAGMTVGSSLAANHEANRAWLEDLACRLCCVLALDRFADYVSDEVVAPVRESCAQTLGVVLVDVPLELAKQTFGALRLLVLQSDLKLEVPAWGACHGGMLGLRYLVGVRPGIFAHEEKLLAQLTRCIFQGLESEDDDIQAIAAATLLPITKEFVEQQPKDIRRMLDVIWNALGGLRDELSTSIGHVMDLLANLCTYPKVLEVLVSASNGDPEGSLSKLVPRLFPFLRHSIVNVRKSVLRSLKIFLSIGGKEDKKWVDLRFLRLIFQNILLEQNVAVAALSLELWDSVMALMGTDEYQEYFQKLFPDFWAIAVALVMTPIGTATRFYQLDTTLLIKPSGSPYDQEEQHQTKSSGAGRVNIDRPLLLGDVSIVDQNVFVRCKIDGCAALAATLVIAGADNLANVTPGLVDFFNSPMSSQLLVLNILLEEYGTKSDSAESVLARATAPLLLNAADKNPEHTFRDLTPLLRGVRTQCWSLISLMASQGNLPASSLPKLSKAIEGDANAGPDAFNLSIAFELAGPAYEKLKAQLSEELQVTMADTLENGRKNLLDSIDGAKEAIAERTTSLKASAAGAYLSVDKSLPAKLNPIIRSLMESIKVEANSLLHDRTSKVLASLVRRLYDEDRAAAANKIVKNLCSFLCVDIKEAPLFSTHSTSSGIMSLMKEEPQKDIFEILRKEHESRLVFIKRQGALNTLHNLATIYGPHLLIKLPELEGCMMSPLKTTDFAKLSEGRDDNANSVGQSVIDNLAVTRALLPFLSPEIQGVILELLPAIKSALFCSFSVIRYVAAKCFSTICQVMPTDGMLYFVNDILPQVTNVNDLNARQGAIECIYHLMITMSESILPYIVFLIVPTLGRMSDADGDIRLIAATTFASIIKLVPLESGIKDPTNMPEELLKGRDEERSFISQMMDVSKVKSFDLPITVKATLRKYQQEGVNWLAFLNKYHLHGVLCDDMGLGKTLQTICIVASDHHIRAEKFKETQNPEFKDLPSLIVCPTTLTGHWVQEFKKYVPSLKTLAYVGNPSARAALTSRIKKVNVVITSYDIARNDVQALSKFDWNYCVLDEGHIIKNANSKLSKAVKKYRSNHRLVLSGTPIQNNVLELWSLFDFLMPGFLGSEKSFNDRFSRPILASRNSKTSSKEQEAAALALEALHKQVLPFLLRRLKEDVLSDLPPKIIQDYYCDLNDTQKKLYDKFTKDQKRGVEQDLADQKQGSKKHIFQALLYLRRLCNHPAFVNLTKVQLASAGTLDYSLSPKLLALQQLLEDCGIGNSPKDAGSDEVPEAMSQHRALIFCQQKDMLDLVENSLLKKHMPDVTYMRLDSSVAGTRRHELVAKFNDDPSIDVLLLSTHVGGLGLNLTGADTVIFVEHDWNPMNDLQAMDRAHRIGQKKVVNVYRLITRGTLEERIMGLQEFKLNIASTVINQQNSGLGSMDTDQILDLFSGSADNAGDSDKIVSVEDQAKAVDSSGKVAAKTNGKDVVSGLTELWDEAEYAEEYDLDNFIKSIKK